MLARFVVLPLWLALVSAGVVACSGTPTGGASCANADWCVDAGSGLDTNTGTDADPFRTITKALSVAAFGEVVHVRPGTYDEGLGETFPLNVPSGVTLRGDEANKGQGATATLITGTGVVDVTGVTHTLVVPGAFAELAGFTVTNTSSTIQDFSVLLYYGAITLRDNSILDSGRGGIYVTNGSDNHLIRDNVVEGNATVGLVFINASGGTKVEANRFRLNNYGVEFDASGGDLGGGSAGSAGGNTLSCNYAHDLWSSSVVTISAEGNRWDHATPTEDLGASESGGGTDIYNRNGGATISTSGAVLAASPCP